MKKLTFLILIIAIFTSGISARKIFHKNKAQIWGDASGFVAGGDVPWHGNSFGVVNNSGDNKVGSGPGGGFRVRVSGYYKLFGIQLSETWGSLSNLTEYKGDGRIQKGEGSMNSFDTKVGLMPFTGDPGDQSYLFV